MSTIKQLQLVLTNTPTILCAVQSANGQLPESLAYCMHKGRLQRLWDENSAITSLESWQQSLLQTLPVELQSVGLPAAALCWCGEGGVPRSGTWMQIELVHFAAGMNDVHIVIPDKVNDEHVQHLMAALQPLLSLAGFELRCSAAGHWYVWCEELLEVHTHAIRSGMTTASYDVLPSGKDAPQVRRLLTEIQMLLHPHPLNQQREQDGLLSLNAVWFSGAGLPMLAMSSTRQRIMSDQPYVQGLCSQLNVSCWPVPLNAAELLRLRDDDMVLVIDGVDLPQLDKHWLQPLLNAVNAGDIHQLSIHLDHWKLTLHGGRWQQLRRWLASDNDIAGLLN